MNRLARADYPVLPGRDPGAASDWLRFVIDHRHPLNLALHVISALVYWGSLVAFVFTREPLLLLTWLLSGGFGIAGHVLARDGHFGAGRPHQVVWFATKLAALVLLGQYRPHVERAEALFGRDFGRKEYRS
jgi:hypothetical protein